MDAAPGICRKCRLPGDRRRGKNPYHKPVTKNSIKEETIC